MIFAPIELLTVYLDTSIRRKVGRLALRNRQIFFEYDPSFPAERIEISPFQLPLRTGLFRSTDAIFDGLYGVFHDSLPDGWGRLLLDRTVEKHGIRRGQLNSLDRLAYVGRQGMGALSYEPDRSCTPGKTETLALDRLAKESAVTLAGQSGEVFEELLRLSGSSAGARPKIVAQVSADKTKVIQTQGKLKAGYEHWMIKFASSQDPPDIGAIEYAYSLMAGEAGIEMPPTHLFRTRKGGYFGARRFDRQEGNRIHMHSLSGLVHADYRNPSLDYDTLLRVVLLLTKNTVDVEKAFALACFNVLGHNRDDHARNFSFLLNENHQWILAPAYDLTFSEGPGGEQSTMVMGEGRTPGVQELEVLGKEHGLRNSRHILGRVREAVSRWRRHATEAGVGARSAKAVADAIRMK